MKEQHLQAQTWQELAESHMSCVHWVIRRYIDVHENVCGLGYEDLYQEGCVALCHAAQSYDAEKAQFHSYAIPVIRNHLLDYCRRIQARRQKAVVLSLEELHTNEPSHETDDVSRLYAAQALEYGKRTYRGVALLGIEALELKAMGYSGTDIAGLYGVNPNHVGAWISRARQKLKKDLDFC